MKRFWAHGTEYAMLEQEDALVQEPIQFGPLILKPGDRIVYMGDGRPHRSFQMLPGLSLQYVGYVIVDGEAQFLLFTVPEQPAFRANGVYYSFLYLEPPNVLCVFNGIGSRAIFLNQVIMASHEPEPIGPVQLSLFAAGWCGGQ